MAHINITIELFQEHILADLISIHTLVYYINFEGRSYYVPVNKNVV